MSNTHSASLNKKGEDQPRLLLFLVLAVVASIFVAVLVLVILHTSANTSKVVLDDQEKYSLYSNTVVRGLFSISALQFADSETATCTTQETYHRPVMLKLQFQTYQVPDSCELFVNDKFLRTERRLDPDCRIACDFQEFNRQFSLGELDYRDNHVVRVCCNNICVERQLEALCSNSG